MVYTSTSTSYIWQSWNNLSTTGSASITSDTFGYWVSAGTATTTISTQIYNIWCEESRTGIITLQQNIERNQESIREFEEQRARQLKLEKERLQRKQEARRKAKILLLENLDMEQFKDFHKEGHFFVKSPSGRLYRIREGRSINIDLMKGNSQTDVEQRLCAHPAILCPNEDTMLVQKIMLEHQEQEFLELARSYEPLH